MPLSDKIIATRLNTDKAKIVFVISAFVFVALNLHRYIAPGVDYLTVFYPAFQSVLRWQNPYAAIWNVYTPFWFFVISPLGLLSLETSWGVFLLLSMAGYAIAFSRLGATHKEVLYLLISPFTVYGLLHGNIDWVVLLGVTMPPAVGVWFMLLKPQMTLPVTLVRLAKDVRSAKYLVLPLVAMVLGYALGLYNVPKLDKMGWSVSVYPYGVPLGLVVLFHALRKRDERVALSAAPLLSPYLAIHSWIGVLMPSIRKNVGFWVLVSWVVVLVVVYLRVA